MLSKKIIQTIMVRSQYSHIVRVFKADRFYLGAKQLARDERNEKFCRLRTNRENSLCLCSLPPSSRIFGSHPTVKQWYAMEEQRARKETEAGRVCCNACERGKEMALFPSLFPQTFPAAPLLPNRFFHPRSNVCVLRSWRAGSDPPEISRGSSTYGEFNVRILKSVLPWSRYWKRFLQLLAFCSTLIDAPKLQSCCINGENHFLFAWL